MSRLSPCFPMVLDSVCMNDSEFTAAENEKGVAVVWS